MNRISKQRIELAKKNFKRFKSTNIVAAMVYRFGDKKSIRQ